MKSIPEPTPMLLELRDKLAAAGHQQVIQHNILTTGKQLCRGHGFEDNTSRALAILIVHGENHWTVMWQVKYRRVNPNDPFYTERQSLFVLKEYRKLVEKNEKVMFGDSQLSVSYEVELNDDDVANNQIELWATAQLKTTVDIMQNFIEMLYAFPQYDINLTKNELDEFVLEISTGA